MSRYGMPEARGFPPPDETPEQRTGGAPPEPPDGLEQAAQLLRDRMCGDESGTAAKWWGTLEEETRQQYRDIVAELWAALRASAPAPSPEPPMGFDELVKICVESICELDEAMRCGRLLTDEPDPHYAERVVRSVLAIAKRLRGAPSEPTEEAIDAAAKYLPAEVRGNIESALDAAYAVDRPRGDDLLAAHRRFHDKVGCPGEPECYVCQLESERRGA